jgi:hypothetical protein
MELKKALKTGFDMKKELIDLLCKKSFQYSEEPVFKLASEKQLLYQL